METPSSELLRLILKSSERVDRVALIRPHGDELITSQVVGFGQDDTQPGAHVRATYVAFRGRIPVEHSVPSAGGLVGILCLPLISRDRVVGVLQVGSRVEAHFSKEDRRLFRRVGDALAELLNAPEPKGSLLEQALSEVEANPALSKSGIAFFDLDLTCVWANLQLSAMVNKEVLGHHAAWVLPEAVLPVLKDVLHGQRGVRFEFSARNEAYPWDRCFLGACSPVRSPDGTLLGLGLWITEDRNYGLSEPPRMVETAIR